MKEDNRVSLQKSQGIPILVISGDVSDAIEDSLKSAYASACESQPQSFILKFDTSGHIYSSGLAALLGVVGEARKKGQRIGVIGLSEHFAGVFRLIGLTKHVELFPSEAYALDTFTN